MPRVSNFIDNRRVTYEEIMQNPKYRALYTCWGNLKKRCTSLNVHNRAYYFDKGIGYPSAWEHFDSFYADMQAGWFTGAILDRIDSSLNYCKENCRWIVSLTESNRNRSSVVLDLEQAEQIRRLYASGKHTQADLGRRFGVSRETISHIVTYRSWT